MLHYKQLSKAFAKVENTNWMFRSFLKEQDPKEVDRIVHHLHQKLFRDFDCVSCSNCCRETGTVVTKKEIKDLAAKTGLTVQDFTNTYIIEGGDGPEIKDTPCPFLTVEGCSVYECRPNNCREYPYTSKKDMTSRLIGLIHNCEICPVVFELFEELKQHYQAEFRRHKSY